MSADDLKQTVLEFVKDLRDNVFTEPEEQSDMVLAELYFHRIHQDRLADDIIRLVLPHKNQISRRDESFFKRNLVIFAGLPDKKIQHFKNTISTRDTDDKQVIWTYFDVIIEIAEKIKKKV